MSQQKEDAVTEKQSEVNHVDIPQKDISDHSNNEKKEEKNSVRNNDQHSSLKSFRPTQQLQQSQNDQNNNNSNNNNSIKNIGDSHRSLGEKQQQQQQQQQQQNFQVKQIVSPVQRSKNNSFHGMPSQHIKKEIFTPTSIYITQEDRIKNQDKIIQYPQFLIPTKHRLKATWDIMIGVFVLYSSFVSPLDIAFEFKGVGAVLYKIGDIITLVFFACDILVNLRTTFYTANNEECIDSKMIAKHYIQSSSFIVDIISTFPIAEISELITGDQTGSGSPSYILWLKQLKIFRILRLAKLNRFLQSDSAKTLYQMIKIFMAFLIIYHWLTCIWYFIVSQDYEPETSNDSNIWLPSNLRTLGQSAEEADDNELTREFYKETGVMQIYSYTLYSLIILTLGNDIAPISVIQAIFAIFICVAGSFLTAIFFGEIAVLISKLNAESTMYQNKLEKLEMKLKHNNIPKVLQTKVLEYFDFCWEKKKLVENVTDFSLLSIPLQKEIHFHLHRDIIKNVPLFKELELNEIVWIIQRLKTDIYLPDDFIIREGEVGNEMFFLMDGVAKIVIKNFDDITAPPLNIYLKKGQYVGEIALIIDSKRTADVQAVDFTICEMFTRESYNLLKQEFPDINKRLKDGLKHYKINKIKDISRTVKAKLFPMLNDEDVDILIRNYMDDIFCEPNKIILSPKNYSNAIYVVLLGKISQMPNTQKSHQVLRQIMQRNNKQQKGSHQRKFKTFDEQMEDFPQEDEYNEVYLKKKVISPGEFFGSVPFQEMNMKPGIQNFFISLTGCQLGIFTEKTFIKLSHEQPEIFKKIISGMNKNMMMTRNSMEIDEVDLTEIKAQKTLKKAIHKVNDFIQENNLSSELDDMHNILLKQLNMFEELNEQITELTRPKLKRSQQNSKNELNNGNSEQDQNRRLTISGQNYADSKKNQ